MASYLDGIDYDEEQKNAASSSSNQQDAGRNAAWEQMGMIFERLNAEMERQHQGESGTRARGEDTERTGESEVLEGGRGIQPFDLSSFLESIQQHMSNVDMDSIVEQFTDVNSGHPTSEQFIKSLPVVEITQVIVDKKLSCSICLEPFQPKEDVRRLPCKHCFHQECVIPWLSKNCTCPSCRKDLPTDNLLYNEERAFQRVARRVEDQEQADSMRRRGHCNKDDDFDSKQYLLDSMYM
eukprot:Nk52_evm37s221 gene=Nk52_evmTU37s221